MPKLSALAQAIWDECGGADPRDGECFEKAAKAVLTLLRRPSAAMVAAGWATDASGRELDPEDVWRAMIGP